MENTNTTKFATDRKFRLAVDPRGAQVVLNYGGVQLVGDVYGVYRQEVSGSTHLKVRHFNGENWPIDPTFHSVDVLVRRGA
jgi:hypothetical protein